MKNLRKNSTKKGPFFSESNGTVQNMCSFFPLKLNVYSRSYFWMAIVCNSVSFSDVSIPTPPHKREKRRQAYLVEEQPIGVRASKCSLLKWGLYRLRHTSNCKTKTSFPFIWIKEKAGFFGGKFVEPLVLDITSSNSPSLILAFRCLRAYNQTRIVFISTTPIWAIYACCLFSIFSSFHCLQSAEFRQISYWKHPTCDFRATSTFLYH
jgi:hypothetical protein